MVLAYHVVFSTYGFRLPNDPRGSNSNFVGADHLKPFGPSTKVHDRRSHATDPHDAALRAAAKRALKYPPVKFNGVQARCVENGFHQCVERTGAIIYACSILPSHVHMVIARHRYDVEKLVGFFKEDATRQLLAEGLHPLGGFPRKDGSLPTPWGAGCRKVFLDTSEAIVEKIAYVQHNLVKGGKKRQAGISCRHTLPDNSEERAPWSRGETGEI